MRHEFQSFQFFISLIIWCFQLKWFFIDSRSFQYFPLSGSSSEPFLWTWVWQDMRMSMNKPIKYWITHKPQRRLKKQRRREGKQTQWNKHKENPRKQWLTGSCGEHIIYYGWFMADLLRLIYGLFIIADFLSFVFFFLTSPKCYEMEDRNSPGLDLCSWCIIISLRCDYVVQLWGVLASRRLGATKLRPDAWLTTTGIKCRHFTTLGGVRYSWHWRSQALLHLRLAMAPRLTSGSWVNCGEHANHSLKSIDVDGEWISTLTHLYAMVTWKWFEISLLHN